MKFFAVLIFQSTLPREERLCLHPLRILLLYFNPRSHERSDCILTECHCTFDISIHAPTRGATSSTCYSTTDHINFNPRSHERSDANRVIVFFNSILFQSTLPREERLIRLWHWHRDGRFQSTLPREERHVCLNVWPLKNDFNPRSHERSDKRLRSSGVMSFNFNPRSHERSDPLPLCQCRSRMNFNPRSHERSDLILVYVNTKISISIHAPTRGATIKTFFTVFTFIISIHAPTRGATWKR